MTVKGRDERETCAKRCLLASLHFLLLQEAHGSSFNGLLCRSWPRPFDLLLVLEKLSIQLLYFLVHSVSPLVHLYNNNNIIIQACLQTSAIICISSLSIPFP